MRKFVFVIALMVSLGLITTTSASAKDLGGRFGVGADSALGWSTHTLGNPPSGGSQDGSVGGPGLSIVYYVSKMFGIQLITAASFTSATDGADGEYSASGLGIALRGHFPIALTNDVNLGGFVGFTFAMNSGSFTPDGGDELDNNSPSFIAFELGIRPEWFVTDHFSLHTQVGINVSILSEDNSGLGDDSSGIAFGIFEPASLLGGAGFTFWF